MKRTLMTLVSVAALGGCQCFNAVDDRDGGAGGGGAARGGGTASGGGSASGGGASSGGGAAGGGAGQCTSEQQCSPSPSMLPFCATPRGSCLEGRCVTGCGGAPGTCDLRADGCYDCAPGGRLCGDCAQAPTCRFTVRGASAGCSAPLVEGARLEVVAFSGRCGAGVSADGGLLGTWLPFDVQTSVVTLQGHGACLGTDLFTGVPRTFVSCPDCSFVAEGCD